MRRDELNNRCEHSLEHLGLRLSARVAVPLKSGREPGGSLDIDDEN
jgi:hypothetical protein